MALRKSLLWRRRVTIFKSFLVSLLNLCAYPQAKFRQKSKKKTAIHQVTCGLEALPIPITLLLQRDCLSLMKLVTQRTYFLLTIKMITIIGMVFIKVAWAFSTIKQSLIDDRLKLHRTGLIYLNPSIRA